MILPCELPIVQAPMAGGPSTPQLTAAVCGAGGYGFVAGGYLSAEALSAALDATSALTGEPFGVNLFVPAPPADPGSADTDVRTYAASLAAEAARLGVGLGDARWEDDAFGAKLDVVLARRPHSVTFAFGCPAPADVERLHTAGVLVGVTVTSAEEASVAAGSGADFVVAQGTEAGGHQGSFLDLRANELPLFLLLAHLRDGDSLPAIATGGVMSGVDVAAALAAGASAVQLGTAFLCTPEAGTSDVYRAALLEARYEQTVLTRAFTGRYARGLANRFAREHGAAAPQAYPQVHHLTRPLRAAATAAGDSDVPNLWAGTGWRRARAEPAARLVRRLAADAAAATLRRTPAPG